MYWLKCARKAWCLILLNKEMTWQNIYSYRCALAKANTVNYLTSDICNMRMIMSDNSIACKVSSQQSMTVLHDKVYYYISCILQLSLVIIINEIWFGVSNGNLLLLMLKMNCNKFHFIFINVCILSSKIIDSFRKWMMTPVTLQMWESTEKEAIAD